jgi:hypothetical protein
VVRSDSQVQQRGQPNKSTQARARTNGFEGAIGGYDIGQVFMDAGCGINLIYAKTLNAMNISLEWLQPTDCSFHGIVPGSANHTLGRIELDVYFGDSGNFRREKLKFEVMDWL